MSTCGAMPRADTALMRWGLGALVLMLGHPAAAQDAGAARQEAAGTGAMRAVQLQPATIVEHAIRARSCTDPCESPAHSTMRNWHIWIGQRRVGDYEFTKRLAALTRAPIADEIRTAYEPVRPRNRLLTVTGYLTGGALVAAGTLMGGLSSLLAHRSCDVTTEAYDPSGCAVHSGAHVAGVAVGSIGLAALLTTGIYQALTAEPLDRFAPYYTKSEAQRLVERYNRLVYDPRAGDGDRACAPTAVDEPMAQGQRERPASVWTFRLDGAGAALAAQF